MRLYINPTLEKSIRSYCEANEIEDVNAFANRCALQGLNIVKFGTSPRDNIERENKGIKDIVKDEKSTRKKEPSRKDETKRETEGRIESGSEATEEKVLSNKREQKKVVVRKIQVIKKGND